MLRLTFLLCSGLFLVMLLGGRDFGQLRPGLAQAETDARALSASAAVPAVETLALASGDAAEAVVEGPVEALAALPVSLPMPLILQKPTPELAPQEEVALIGQTSPELAPTEPESTVFTLSRYADTAVEPEPTLAEQAPQGEIWYVAGNSLNVRSGPSTNDEIVGKLTQGEATLVVWREGEDWARIRIEGDGIEGYVAMRFLSPNVPVIN